MNGSMPFVGDAEWAASKARHPNEVNVRAKPYFEAMLKEAEQLGPEYVAALKAQRARQLAVVGE